MRGLAHDAMSLAGVGSEDAVIPQRMDPRSGYWGGESSDEVTRFEQHVSGAIGESMFEFVDHQPIARQYRLSSLMLNSSCSYRE